MNSIIFFYLLLLISWLNSSADLYIMASLCVCIVTCSFYICDVKELSKFPFQICKLAKGGTWLGCKPQEVLGHTDSLMDLRRLLWGKEMQVSRCQITHMLPDTICSIALTSLLVFKWTFRFFSSFLIPSRQHHTSVL